MRAPGGPRAACCTPSMRPGRRSPCSHARERAIPPGLFDAPTPSVIGTANARGRWIDEVWTTRAGIRSPSPFIERIVMDVSAEQARRNLDKIKHLVVLMMENRSFDHMLGYLTADGVPEVDGLDPERHGNEGPDGQFHRVRPLGARLLHEKVLDPGYGEEDVRIQLEHGNGGFVRSYVKALERNKARHPGFPADLEFDPTLVLGYQTAQDVPVYDWIARHFQVCDRWFSSVPGPTWPNRLYATTGGRGRWIRPDLLGALPRELENAPIFDRPAFVRWLDDDAWRWYSHDPATLRLIDSRFRPGGERRSRWDHNFAYFNRTSLLERETFLDDAREGRLRPVSWIDPNFVDFRLWGPPGSNDDHPPSRVMLGQELVLTVLTALMESPQWESTLLLITYDEHGGLYDHVLPGDFEVPGDPGASYGVRVPALIVSPYVEPGVARQVFDHTSILRTILLRFAKDPEAALAAMGPRAENAEHLGPLLTRPAGEPRRTPTASDLRHLVDAVADWKLRAYAGQLLEAPHPGEQLFEVLTDLQGEIVSGALFLRHEGLPPGKP